MVFNKKCILEAYDSDSSGLIDNASIFEALTSVSKAHTDYVGIVLPNDIVWMVLDWKLRITRRPAAGETCTIRTWVPGWNKAYGVRCYDMTDEKGCKCLEASSRWALVNAKTRKLFRMTSDIMDLYGIDKDISSLEKSEFIKNIAKDAVCIKSCNVDLSDNMIDENNHVHNTVYSTLAEKILPEGANTDSVDISYRKEIDPEEKVRLEYCRYENKNMILIKNNENSDLNAIVLF